MYLQRVIDELGKRADHSELISLLASNRQTQAYHADLARELRGLAGTLSKELDRRSATHAAGQLRAQALLEAEACFGNGSNELRRAAGDDSAQ